MKYQLGDKVLILHSDEEAVIVDFINDKMVMVDVRGVKFPVYMDQIDFPYYKQFTKKKQEPVKPQRKYVDDVKAEKSYSQRKEDGVWLHFLPAFEQDEFGDEVVTQLKITLINNTNLVYQFIYKLNFFGEPDFELKNTVRPFEQFYLHDVPFEDMNDSPAFQFEFSLQQPDKTKETHYEAAVKLKPKQLFAKIEELQQKNQASFSQLLFEKYPNRSVPADDGLDMSKLTGKGFKVYNAKEARKHLEPARSVVDLHIEKLADDWKHMSNFEILTLQLQTFEQFYDLAIAHMQPSLTIIHGVGTGKLRDELHELLRLKREVNYFVNQYHPAYGFGATEIYFKY